MSTLFATPNALLAWLKELSSAYRVLAPRQQGTVSLFKPISGEELDNCQDVNKILMRTTMSAKEAVIPKCETLFYMKGEKDPADFSKIIQEIIPSDESQATIVFGGRPCDAKGFLWLDEPYLKGPFVDPYYKAHREKLVIITQACTNALSTCFCNWVGSNPSDDKGSDILFTPAAEGFVLVAISEKGKELLEKSGFGIAGEEQVSAANTAQEQAKAELPPASVIKDIPKKVYARFTDVAFWENEIEKCLSCGACTFLCPTCQCFTITDEGNQLDGKRIRSWDGCMANHFTLEASGHNPRCDRGLRYRNRVGHKFSYGREEGSYSCVGCGRCTRSCPAHLDIRAVVRNACTDLTDQGDALSCGCPVDEDELI